MDGMAFVHSMKKEKTTKTCLDFAVAFSNRLLMAAEKYENVYLVFDRYLSNSLKTETRNNRKKTASSRLFFI
jgi:hypothetical protein